MFVTVTEKWNYDCGDDARVLVHFRLDEMQAEGKFVINELTDNRSAYGSDGSPTKIFTSIEYANSYIDFCSNLKAATFISIALISFK